MRPPPARAMDDAMAVVEVRFKVYDSLVDFVRNDRARGYRGYEV